MSPRGKLISGLLWISVALVSAGCAADKAADTAAPPSAAASTSPSSGQADTYCANVRRALSVQPPSGPIDKAVFGRYAEAVDQVQAAAPAAGKAYWAAVAKTSHSIADGGQGNPDTAAVAFKEMSAVAVAVKKQCGIDIVASK